MTPSDHQHDGITLTKSPNQPSCNGTKHAFFEQRGPALPSAPSACFALLGWLRTHCHPDARIHVVTSSDHQPDGITLSKSPNQPSCNGTKHAFFEQRGPALPSAPSACFSLLGWLRTHCHPDARIHGVTSSDHQPDGITLTKSPNQPSCNGTKHAFFEQRGPALPSAPSACFALLGWLRTHCHPDARIHGVTSSDHQPDSITLSKSPNQPSCNGTKHAFFEQRGPALPSAPSACFSLLGWLGARCHPDARIHV